MNNTDIWQLTVHALIRHPEREALRMVKSDDGYALPHATTSCDMRGILEAKMGRLPQPILDALSPVHLLRIAHEEMQPGQCLLVWEMEVAPLTDGEWIDLTRSNDFRGFAPRTTEVRRAGRPVVTTRQRPAWAKPGWFARAKTWIESELERHHYQWHGIEPIRSWGLSLVAKIETQREPLYFKAIADLPLSAQEGQVMATLANWYPEYVPAPLAVHQTERWMLLPHVDKDELDEVPSLAEQERFLRVHSQIQVDSVSRTDVLLQAGCAEHRLEQFASQIEAFLLDELTTERLEPEEVEQLHRYLPALLERCHEIASCAIPPALIHGDFTGGNILIDDEGFVFIDWSNTAITFPFFDMLFIARTIDDKERAYLRDIYLSYWTDYAPLSDLQTIWERMLPLLYIYYLMSYHQLLSSIEFNSVIVADMYLTYGLKELLRMLNQGSQFQPQELH